MSCSRCSCRATTSRDDEKLADFEYYDPLTTGDSTLSAVVQSILAAEVGYQDLALEYFLQSIVRRPRRPAPQRRPTACTSPPRAGCGPRWSRGFGGMRDHFGELTFDPRLPAIWDELVVHACTGTAPAWRSPSRRSELRIEAEGGVEVEFEVRGDRLPGRLRAKTVVVPLADQGPVIAGRPSLDRVRGRPPRGRHDPVGLGADRDDVDHDHRGEPGRQHRSDRCVIRACARPAGMSAPRRRLER